MKVIITEHIADEGVQIFKDSGLDISIQYKLSREALLECIGEYDAIIVRSVTKINAEFFEHASNLKVVGRAGNGVDNIDLAAATKAGVIVVNTPDANTVSAAEHTIGLMLAACRNIPRADAHIRSKQWDRTLFRGVELMDKTLGIVGLGRIGSMVATRMQAFGMTVIAYDPYIGDDRFEKLSVKREQDLNSLISKSDILSIHTPKTPETIGIISTEQFKLAKKGLRVVNCARGGLIDEEALYNAIKDGIVAGAGIDVLKDEPHPISPLLDLKETVVTPHLGADTFEAQKNVGETVAREVIEALKGKIVAGAVNMPSINASELEILYPHLKLAEGLGKLYYQVRKDPLTKVEILYKGDVCKYDTAPITLAFLKGLFETILSGTVNYVNAKFIADERSITVIEGKDARDSNYNSSIAVKFHNSSNSYTLEGALFGKEQFRFVDINGYNFDVAPKENMLLIENIDQPGIIGKIGQTLGNENINISTMNVSLSEKDGHAMMFLTVDAPVSDTSLEVIKATDGIVNATTLTF